MREALRNRDFRLLLTGQFLSSLGDWLLVVAAPFYVWQLTGSALATGLAIAAEMVPALLLGPVAGVFVDRWDHRAVMIAADVLRAGATGLLLCVHSADQVWVIYVALALESSFSQFFLPARQALIPALVGRGTALVSANSLGAFVSGTIRLVGAPLGGALYAVVGFGPVIGVDAGTYLASAALIALVRHRTGRAGGAGRSGRTGPLSGGRTRPVPGGRGALRRFGAEVTQGWAHVRTAPGFAATFGAAGLFFVGNSALTALLVPFVSGVLHAGSRTLGLLLGGLGAGFVVGAPLGRYVTARVPLRRSLAGAFGALGVVFLLAFHAPDVVSATVLFALIGPPAVCALVAIDTFIQRETADGILGRVSAAYLTLQAAATLLGSLAGAALGQGWSTDGTIDLAGALVLAAAGCSFLIPTPERGQAPGPAH
ncbi:MFS transporter [Longispora fulva]|uniref:Putative MFS family arabinose efflux permease n=1 Tax=Longispora fulva TaxID=619741 RepID=A0A8J7GE07_9ACTN|nr:putative MFS family arabinose efflux permease [Longispora fulva]GIG61688.1 MFS transporter [Longispora fulva]